ncbi:MAG: hypothetical protein KDJ52_30355 [Anaerolineae bacterium]|nr:hypothetical protein [Anaerolineae bacterium]
MSRSNDIDRLLIRYNRRLQGLKEKQAQYGLETPISILTEIDDIEIQIEELQKELEKLNQTDESQSNKPLIETKGISLKIPSLKTLLLGFMVFLSFFVLIRGFFPEIIHTLTPAANPSPIVNPISSPLPISKLLLDYVSDSVNPSLLGQYENRWSHVNYSRQYFTDGVMLWLDNPNGMDNIYVIVKGGRDKKGYIWARYDNSWTPNNSIIQVNCPSIDTEKGPLMGFGKVWCENESVRKSIGLPLDKEFAFNDAVVEFYREGLLFLIPKDKQIWVLLYNGNWFTIEL